MSLKPIVAKKRKLCCFAVKMDVNLKRLLQSFFA